MLEILFKKGRAWRDGLIDTLGLGNERNKKAGHLSTGLRQRLAIAMALYRDPSLLILDEPINGLDPQGIIDIRNLISELHDRGKTIIYSSHIISEIQKVCTDIGIIDSGMMKFEGKPSEVDGNLEDFYIKMTTR